MSNQFLEPAPEMAAPPEQYLRVMVKSPLSGLRLIPFSLVKRCYAELSAQRGTPINGAIDQKLIMDAICNAFQRLTGLAAYEIEQCNFFERVNGVGAAVQGHSLNED